MNNTKRSLSFLLSNKTENKRDILQKMTRPERGSREDREWIIETQKRTNRQEILRYFAFRNIIDIQGYSKVKHVFKN